MQRYDSYKDSGIQWLGEIPSHWEVLAIKHILKPKKKIVGKQSFRYDLLSLTLQGIIKRDVDNPTGKFPSSFDTYQEVNKGDFVFCNFDNEETPRAVGLSCYNGMITGAYDVLSIKNPLVSPSYLIYYFLYIDDAKRFKPLYKGLRKTVPFDSFMSYKIPIPPLPEQQAIASYLDTATAKIDEAIAQQQKMIDLLNERKQIIINNAVTKGLNPNAPTKPSGIDWIGNIPEHWEVNKLKNCAKTNSGSTPRSIAGKENPTSTIRWVRTTDLHNNIVEDTSEYISEKEMASASCPWLPQGTVLISMYGGSGSFGKVGLLNIEATINQALCSINCNSSISPMYMFYYLQSVHRIWMKYAASSRKDPNLNQETIRNLDVVVPPLEEQECIINAIQEKLKSIGTVIEIFEHQMLLLQERKQIIINDVVTGKVKV